MQYTIVKNVFCMEQEKDSEELRKTIEVMSSKLKQSHSIYSYPPETLLCSLFSQML